MPNDINGDDYYNANASFYDGKVQAFHSTTRFSRRVKMAKKTSLCRVDYSKFSVYNVI